MAGKALMLLIIFGTAVGIELPGLIKKKQWKDVWVFSAVLTIGMALITLQLSGVVEFSLLTDWIINVFGLSL